MAYDQGDRPKFKGNWNCGKCGADIKELPFNPDPARMNQLTCGDCYKKSRQ